MATSMDNEWLQGLNEEDQFLARIVGAETEEEYEAIPVSVRNAWRGTYRNIENKGQSIDSLKDAGVIDEDIYNAAKAAGYNGSNFSDITPEQWREIYNGYMEGYNAFAKQHPDIPYRFRNQDRYRSQWDESYEGYTGKQERPQAQPKTTKVETAQAQPTKVKEEENVQEQTTQVKAEPTQVKAEPTQVQPAETQEDVSPLEVRDVQGRTFPEVQNTERAKADTRMRMTTPEGLEVTERPVSTEEAEETEETRGQTEGTPTNGTNTEQANQGQTEEREASSSKLPEEPTTTETPQQKQEIGYKPVARWQAEGQREEGRGYGWQNEAANEAHNAQPQVIPEEEQDDYKRNGGVLPISNQGTAERASNNPPIGYKGNKPLFSPRPDRVGRPQQNQQEATTTAQGTPNGASAVEERKTTVAVPRSTTTQQQSTTKVTESKPISESPKQTTQESQRTTSDGGYKQAQNVVTQNRPTTTTTTPINTRTTSTTPINTRTTSTTPVNTRTTTATPTTTTTVPKTTTTVPKTTSTPANTATTKTTTPTKPATNTTAPATPTTTSTAPTTTSTAPTTTTLPDANKGISTPYGVDVDDVDEAPIVQQREPARLNRWYETLFRQDNAGEEAEISEEQRRKMARRERAERVIAGLGDIGTHIANIALAGKGAVPAKPSTTMSANIDNSWQRYNQDIEQRRRAYRQGLNAARQMDYRQYIDDRRQAALDAKEERLRWQAEQKYAQDKARDAREAVKLAEFQKKSESEINLLKERAEYWDAREEEARAKAAGKIPIGRSYGGGSKTNAKSENKEAPYHTPDGVPAYNRDSYHVALLKEADKYGVKYRKKDGRPYITDWAILEYQIEEERSRRGLPRKAQTTGQETESKTTEKTEKTEKRGKMDISGYKKTNTK